MFAVIHSRIVAAAMHWRYLPRALRVAWEAAPRQTAAWLALLVAQGALPLATVMLTRTLVDGIAGAIRTGAGLERVLAAAAAIAAVLAAGEALRSLATLVRTAQADLVQDHISTLIHRKSAAVDMAFYDSAEYYDDLHRARIEAGYRPVALLDSSGSLLQNAVTLAAMMAVLAQFGLWVAAALLLCTVPALYVFLSYAAEQHLWRVRTTPHERRAFYYDWLLTTDEPAAEIRLFGLGALFQERFLAIRKRLRGERLALAKRQAGGEFAAGAAALAMTAAAVGWMVWRAARGLVSLGDVAMFYQAFQQGLRLMRTVLENIRELYANSLFLGHLFHFLDLKSALALPRTPRPAPAALSEGIRFLGVSFRYPGSEAAVLSGLDVTIPAGRITAVLGPNGAGKSTLLKLLCRFYDPGEGRIEMDGIDLREIAPEELRRRLSVLFQMPVRYCASARENIAYGDMTAGAAGIERAAARAGADAVVGRFGRGYDTVLGRWFDEGTDLSTGEWQRIALARAFLRAAPVMLLDEPTSAMDPWAEADWLARFRALAAGNTTLLITHRLSTAMHADLICVLTEGRIAETGTHAELLARGGLYAQAWRAQAQADRDWAAAQ